MPFMSRSEIFLEIFALSDVKSSQVKSSQVKSSQVKSSTGLGSGGRRGAIPMIWDPQRDPCWAGIIRMGDHIIPARDTGY